MDPSPVKPPITENLTADIPGINLQDIQLSYAKDYVAYKDSGVLKVFNFKQKKVVFTKAPPSGSGKSMGVLDYEWLPDRNTLIYFYARKNPNPVTYTVVYPPTQSAQTAQANSGNISQELPKTEDPNQAKKSSTTPKVQSNINTGGEGALPAPKPKVIKHYGNPQLTELYTLTLPESNDTTTEPDDRFNQTLTQFPAGGEIEQMAFSTFTNLMYLLIRTGSATELLRIDVMKEVQLLSRAGETITNMTVSDRYGTLYIETKTGGRKEIVALDAVHGWKRTLISQNTDYTILGERSGLLYLGDVKNGDIVKILSLTETGTVQAYPNFHTDWTGTIPFEKARVQIGSHNEIIIYNSGKAYIVSNGHVKSVDLHGSDNYISVDGAELVQMTREGNLTHFVLQPLAT